MNEKQERLDEISVRHGKDDDVAGIVACLEAAFEPYRSFYTEDAFNDTVPTVQDTGRRFRDMKVIVAEIESAGIIGTIAYKVVGQGEGHLRSMAVAPEFQGRGIAERLLSAAERELRKAGCSRVTLDTTRPLKKAMRFYERHGYKLSGAVGDFFGMPLFEYEKALDAAAV